MPTRDHPMTTLRIVHTTRYDYDRPVTFGTHHLLLRPRDAHDTRLLSSNLIVTPKAEINWAFDTFGNSVGSLTFRDGCDELVITSELELRRYGLDDPIPPIERRASDYPFDYDADDAIDLAPLRSMLFPQDRPALECWINTAIPRFPTSSVKLLHELSREIHTGFRYQRRKEYGVQSPAETIHLGDGTCRDFALFFMEAARVLGFAARFVTGYLYDPNVDGVAGRVRGGGSTHAWADIFIPGVGWIEFDPTNQIVASRNLVRVATTRSPSQAVPVSGSYRPDGASFLGMEVSVNVTRIQ